MKKIFIAAFIALTLSACNDDDRLAYDDNSGDKIAGFPQASQSASYFEDEGQVTLNVPVVLLGLGNGQVPSQSVELAYEIDAVNTTAVEGGEYNFTDNSRRVTIPAGATFVNLPILVNTGDLNPTSATKLVLTLKPVSQGLVVLETSKQLTVNFVGCISTIVPGNYTALVTSGNNTGFTFSTTIAAAGVNTFLTGHTFPYYPNTNYPGRPRYGFIFEDICGVIDIPAQNLFTNASNIVQGSGEVVDANTFKVSYTHSATNLVPATLTLTRI